MGRAGEKGRGSNWGLGLILLPYGQVPVQRLGRGMRHRVKEAKHGQERSLSATPSPASHSCRFQALPDRIWATRPDQTGTCEEPHLNSEWNLEWALVPSLDVSPEDTGVGKGGNNINQPSPPHQPWHSRPTIPGGRSCQSRSKGFCHCSRLVFIFRKGWGDIV